MSVEAIGLVSISCEGVSKTKVAPLKDQPANPTVTVFNNGTRLIGCTYLDQMGNCLAGYALEERGVCIQLFPQSDTEIASHSENSGKTESIMERLTHIPGTPIPLNIDIIKGKMIELSLPQAKLADSLHISQATVSNIMHAKRRIRLGTSIAFASAFSSVFNIPLEELVANPADAERINRIVEGIKQSREILESPKTPA